MIHGVGVDLVEIQRIRISLERFGERFAHRILSDVEYEEFLSSRNQAQFLAKRFAAKEALAKALGTGFKAGLSPRHISVGHDSLGRPLLRCTERAQDMFKEFAIGASHLSLSDEADFALAYVMLERD